MKNYLLGFLLFILGGFSVTPTYANHLPSPSGHINDFANILSQEQKTDLEQDLVDYQNQTGNEIAVVYVKSLDGQDIDDFTVRAFEEWKVGQKGKDNGILFLAAIDDHKMRIEVGYGLEPYLTDAQAGSIIRNTIAPYFKENDYYSGTKAGIFEIEHIISGGSPESSQAIPKDSPLRKIVPIFIEPLLVLLIAIFPYFFAFMARTKSVWLGGISGSAIGLIIGILASSIILSVILIFVIGGLGLLLDWILSTIYHKRRISGEPTNWWNSGGGFFPSSGSRSSFGGFSGGSSGGGGASGSW